MNTDSDQKVKVLVNGSWIFFPRSFLQILGKCQTCLKTIRRAKWWFWNDTSNSFCQSFNKKFSTIDTYFANYNASLWNLFFLLVVKNSHHGKQLLEVFVYIYFWILATVSDNSVRYQAVNVSRARKYCSTALRSYTSWQPCCPGLIKLFQVLQVAPQWQCGPTLLSGQALLCSLDESELWAESWD